MQRPLTGLERAQAMLQCLQAEQSAFTPFRVQVLLILCALHNIEVVSTCKNGCPEPTKEDYIQACVNFVSSTPFA